MFDCYFKNLHFFGYFDLFKIYLCFIDDLDGNLLASGDVFGELHLGEVALPDRLQQPIFSYVWLLPCSTPADSRAWLALINV